MVKYIDNFVSSYLLKDIQTEILTSKNFLWQYRSETSGQYPAPDFAWIQDKNTKDAPQLIHVCNLESKDIKLIGPLLYKIMEEVGYEIELCRVKANLLWPDITVRGTGLYHRPHADHAKPGSKSLIYYVNDSDGDTVIFKNRWRNTDPGELIEDIRIKPKAGSAVLFDSDLYHSSSSPTEGVRVVLNFIFWRKETDPSDQLGVPPIPNIPIGIGKGFHGI